MRDCRARRQRLVRVASASAAARQFATRRGRGSRAHATRTGAAWRLLLLRGVALCGGRLRRASLCRQRESKQSPRQATRRVRRAPQTGSRCRRRPHACQQLVAATHRATESRAPGRRDSRARRARRCLTSSRRSTPSLCSRSCPFRPSNATAASLATPSSPSASPRRWTTSARRPRWLPRPRLATRSRVRPTAPWPAHRGRPAAQSCAMAAVAEGRLECGRRIPTVGPARHRRGWRARLRQRPRQLHLRLPPGATMQPSCLRHLRRPISCRRHSVSRRMEDGAAAARTAPSRRSTAAADAC